MVCGLSGGVDSAVAGALVHRAIGDQLTCIFVDHGMLRKDEAQQVERAFHDALRAHFIHVQAEERFLARLAGVTEGDLDRQLKTAVAFAEPLMLFIVAAFIGTIFIGMLLPIFTLQQYIK